MPWLVEQKGKLFLSVYIQPRSSRNRVAGLHGEAVKLCITAPPVEGKANQAVIKYLAGLFNIPKSALEIKSGQQSRSKKIILNGISLTTARQALEEVLDS